MSKRTVWRWRDRFLAEGVDGLLRDATRPDARAPVDGLRAIDSGPEKSRKKDQIPAWLKTWMLQGLARPEVRAQGPRRRGPLCQPARPRRRAVR